MTARTTRSPDPTRRPITTIATRAAIAVRTTITAGTAVTATGSRGGGAESIATGTTVTHGCGDDRRHTVGTGGTSGATPFLGANLAAMSAHQRGRGFPSIGFANAWLYSAAAGTKPAFFDITSGTNGVQLVGCCSAYRGYDMASGLGAPIMDGLYATLPRPAG